MSVDPDEALSFGNPGLPVIPLQSDYPDGFVIEPHHHRRHQLLHAACGVVVVATPQGTWVMPPGRGMWIPAGVTHEVRILGAVRMHSLYFEPARIEMAPECRVLALGAFMRSLIAEAVQLTSPLPIDGRTEALMALIQHEVQRQPRLALSLPFPAHEALSARCRAFLTAPNAHETIDSWAQALGMSRRAFTRAFKVQTGLSFMEWRQQACLVAALPRLVAGEAVTRVAIDLGYDNPAAFTAMFKRALGASPRSWLGENT